MPPDPRIQRTQQRLRQALIALILEQGYDSISIRDITARAQVGYATFFRHYVDKDALLMNTLQRSIADLADLLPPGARASPEQEGRLIFEHVARNDRLYSVLFSGDGTHALLAQIVAAAEEQVTARYVPSGESIIPFAILVHHLVTSIIALIGWWLEQDMQGTPEEMGTIYAELIMQPFSRHAVSRVDAQTRIDFPTS